MQKQKKAVQVESRLNTADQDAELKGFKVQKQKKLAV